MNFQILGVNHWKAVIESASFPILLHWQQRKSSHWSVNTLLRGIVIQLGSLSMVQLKDHYQKFLCLSPDQPRKDMSFKRSSAKFTTPYLVTFMAKNEFFIY